jgi:flagellar biosynthesis protein FlhB
MPFQPLSGVQVSFFCRRLLQLLPKWRAKIMREFTRRFADFERLPTHKAINGELMFLFGITIQDFLAALTVFVGLCMFPGFYTPFIAFGSAFVVLRLSKKIRNSFPKKYFKHLFWAFGLFESKVIKNPFRAAKRRFVSFGP